MTDTTPVPTRPDADQPSYLDVIAGMVAAEIQTVTGDPTPAITGPDDPADDWNGWSLYRVYALLVLTTGEMTTNRNVHDAWSAWTAAHRPDHRSLIPFERLAPAVAALDEPYRQAIVNIAARLHAADLDHPSTYIRRSIDEIAAPGYRAIAVSMHADRADQLATELDAAVHDADPDHAAAMKCAHDAFLLRSTADRVRRTTRMAGAITVTIPDVGPVLIAVHANHRDDFNLGLGVDSDVTIDHTEGGHAGR